MFAVENDLQPKILAWLDANLRDAPATRPAVTAGSPTIVEEFWTTLNQPGGLSRARQLYDEAKKRDTGVVLFPETETNLLGYQWLRDGEVKDAIASLIQKKVIELQTRGASPNMEALLEKTQTKLLELMFDPIEPKQGSQAAGGDQLFSKMSELETKDREKQKKEQGGSSYINVSFAYKMKEIRRSGTTVVNLNTQSPRQAISTIAFGVGNVWKEHGEDPQMFKTVNLADPATTWTIRGNLFIGVCIAFLGALAPAAYALKEGHPAMPDASENLVAGRTPDPITAAILRYARPGDPVAHWGVFFEPLAHAGVSLGTRDAHIERALYPSRQQEYYLDRFVADVLERRPRVLIDTNALRAVDPRSVPGRIRDLGSACSEQVFVASGRLTAAIFLGEQMHDLAAGAVITHEAGCRFGTLDGRTLSPAEFVGETPVRVPTFIAPPRRLAALMARTRRLPE